MIVNVAVAACWILDYVCRYLWCMIHLGADFFADILFRRGLWKGFVMSHLLKLDLKI